MNKEERILRKMFPDRRDFSEEEVSYVGRVLSAYLEPSSRNTALPSRFVEVGDSVEVGGYRYKCVLRERISAPCEACKGCDFSRKYRNCGDVQCSSFDRRDGRNVWFAEIYGK